LVKTRPDFASGIVSICFTPGMHSRIAALTILALVALVPSAMAGGKKENKASVTFHMETAATDNPKMIFPQMANGQTRYFLRTPEIGTKDIVSFSPFPSDVAGDYGMVVKVKPGVVTRLAAVTNANQGRWMIVQVNGRVVDGVMIDKQIDDGVLVVWKGVTLADVSLLDEQYPRTGETGKKKK